MKYSPSRDIPKAVRELRTLSPSEIALWVKEHRTRKVGKRKVQYEINPEAITMYFKRHPKLRSQLEEFLKEEEIAKEYTTDALFQNGIFEKIPCVEKWILEYKARKGKQMTLSNWLGHLKRICMGVLPRTKQQVMNKEPAKHIEEWGIKHPKRLNLDDAMRYLVEAEKTGAYVREYRLALRNFFKSRNVEGWHNISGSLETSAGKFAYLYVSPPKMRELFKWLKQMNKEAHDIAFTAYKTAGRRTALLNAEAKYVDVQLKRITLFEKASKHQPKRRVIKTIPHDLWEVLEPRINKGGKLFDVEVKALMKILRASFEAVIPELAKDIPMPLHFFRHQFAQHMLRATDWNYALVAKLGDWKDERTLRTYYGEMPEEIANKTGQRYLEAI